MRLEEKYTKEIKDAMMSKFNYKSVMQIPKLVKVVVNMGVSDARGKLLRLVTAQLTDLALITGQKPIVSQKQESLSQHLK